MNIFKTSVLLKFGVIISQTMLPHLSVAEQSSEYELPGYETLLPPSPGSDEVDCETNKKRHGGSGSTAKNIHYGNVHISSPEMAEEYRCTQIIKGNLKIDDGVLESLAFPELEKITGCVTLVYEQNLTEELFQGANFEIAQNETETFYFPKLTKIGGSLSLISIETSLDISTIYYQFGLPNLTYLGRNLSIEVRSFNADLFGLDSLETIRKNFYLDMDADDSASSILSNLSVVKGDALLNMASNSLYGFFNSLEFVGGNLVVEGDGRLDDGNPSYTSLTQVLGELQINSMSIGQASFAALEYTGFLKMDNVSEDPNNPVPEQFGSDSMLVGGVNINNLIWLDDLNTTLPNVSIAPNGSVSFTNNSGITDCQVQDWVDTLPGPLGPVDISGNAPC